MEVPTDKYAAILLAAGSSSRLGRPKQLLPFKGGTLLQHAVNTALSASVDRVILVTGTLAFDADNQRLDERFLTVHNTIWEEGIASSIRCGLQALESGTTEYEGAILMVCDQPFVTAGLLDELLDKHRETGRPIVASRYGEVIGTPAFFHRSLFPDLHGLRGDHGARGLILAAPAHVSTVSFEEGSVDIDRMDDYRRLLGEEGQGE